MGLLGEFVAAVVPMFPSVTFVFSLSSIPHLLTRTLVGQLLADALPVAWSTQLKTTANDAQAQTWPSAPHVVQLRKRIALRLGGDAVATLPPRKYWTLVCALLCPQADSS